MPGKGKTSDEKLFEMAVKDVLSRQSGRRVLAWVMKFSGVDEANFDADPLRLAYLNGKREVGVGIRRVFDGICPELVDQMIQEARKDERRQQ